MTSKTLDYTALRKSLLRDAKSLDIPTGAAKVFVDRTLKGVEQSLKTKKIITEADLNRAIVKELKKYHKDFAFVYQNRDKII